jgi:hypothetical protein
VAFRRLAATLGRNTERSHALVTNSPESGLHFQASVTFGRFFAAGPTEAVDSPFHCLPAPSPRRWSGVAIKTFGTADGWGLRAAPGAESNDGCLHKRRVLDWGVSYTERGVLPVERPQLAAGTSNRLRQDYRIPDVTTNLPHTNFGPARCLAQSQQPALPRTFVGKLVGKGQLIRHLRRGRADERRRIQSRVSQIQGKGCRSKGSRGRTCLGVSPGRTTPR